VITMDQTLTPASELLQLEDEHVAHNYHPLDVVVASGSGAVPSTWISSRLTPPRTSATATQRWSPPPRSNLSDSR
jgi:hypothetical protein